VSPPAKPRERADRGVRPWTGLAGALVAVLVIAGGAIAFGLLRSRPVPTLPLPAPACTATLNDGRQARLTIEQAGNASLIAGVASQRGLAPRATSIALATALQESGLRNLDHGDLDSLGLFQQRPAAGWGTPEQIMDPYYSTGKFFDAMVKVPNWQEADIGEVAQEVQRSAFPEAYDKHVERARILASALTGETPTGWTCHVRDPRPADPAGLSSALSRAYGALAAVGPIDWGLSDGTAPPDPPQITVRTVGAPAAWSLAAFAQSWAATYGVAVVQVGDSVWTGQPDVPADWVSQPAGAEPTPVADPTTVVVTFRGT